MAEILWPPVTGGTAVEAGEGGDAA